MKERIIGIDVARALAIIGMIIVNFKVSFGDIGDGCLKSITRHIDGKAAATFVVLAGVGIALMAKTAVKLNDKKKITAARIRIAKRALFLFGVGLLWIEIFPPDILHYYGLYMAVTILLLSSKNSTILISGLFLILTYPLLFVFLDYETGWNFETLEYSNFWSFNGFLRNLFFNGFHPIIPWTSFMLFGYWFGKQDLYDHTFLNKVFWISTITFLCLQLLSYFSISFLSEGSQDVAMELSYIIGMSPKPPLPFYMFSGTAMAFSIISACIIVAKKYENNFVIDALKKTGQLALTFYVAHVIIGIGIIEAFDPSKMMNYPIEFSVIYAIVFSAACVLFAVIWSKYLQHGPLEWLMRKVAG